MGRAFAGGRSPDRVVELTDDFVQNIEKFSGGTKKVVVYYDRDNPRLAVYRAYDTQHIIYRCYMSTNETRGLQALGLKKASTPYMSNKRLANVAEAKAWVESWVPKIAEGLEKVKDQPVVKAEAILDDRPPEEQAHYENLMGVLMDAYAQATNGKGTERHAGGDVSFDKQDMMLVMDRVGPSFALGQAIKKVTESQRLRSGAARQELLGAIIYLAGAIVWKDRQP